MIAVGGTSVQVLRDRLAWPTDWSRDGRTILMQSIEPRSSFDVSVLNVTTKQVTPLIATPAGEGMARFSPDGRWVAFASDVSGRFEVYACPLAEPTRHVPISAGGGSQPHWSEDGRELFYLSGNRVMSVNVPVVDGVLKPDAPKTLFEVSTTGLGGFFGGDFAPARDGTRFLVNREVERVGGALTVIVNWPLALLN